MDPNECYAAWCRALLEENADDEAKVQYNALRAWLDRGGFEPSAWSVNSLARRQFFRFNPSTGRLE